MDSAALSAGLAGSHQLASRRETRISFGLGPVMLSSSGVEAANSEYQRLTLLPGSVPDEEN